MQVWCPSDHSYCQSIGPPRRHFRHGENGSRLRFLEISRKIPRYRAKNTVLGTYRRKPVDFRPEDIPTLRFGGVLAISDDFLGDFPRVLATWYHFSGNFHRYVLSFRLGVPIPDPFLEDAAMASPKRRAGAFFRVGNTSQAYQPYTNIVALFKGYKSVLYSYQTPMASMCSIRSPCRIGYFYFTPNAAHARHGRLGR